MNEICTHRNTIAISGVDNDKVLRLPLREFSCRLDELLDRFDGTAKTDDSEFLSTDTIIRWVAHRGTEVVCRSRHEEQMPLVPEPDRAPMRMILHCPPRLLQQSSSVRLTTGLGSCSKESETPGLDHIGEHPVRHIPVQGVPPGDGD